MLYFPRNVETMRNVRVIATVPPYLFPNRTDGNACLNNVLGNHLLNENYAVILPYIIAFY
jgi:hypothetical protein